MNNKNVIDIVLQDVIKKWTGHSLKFLEACGLVRKQPPMNTHSWGRLHNLQNPVQNGKRRDPCSKIKYFKIVRTGTSQA